MTRPSVVLLRTVSAVAALAFVLLSGWDLAATFSELRDQDAARWAGRVTEALRAKDEGYRDALELTRRRYPALVAVQLLSVDGHDVAHAPPAITRYQWGLAAPLLRGTRYLYWILVSGPVAVDLDAGPVRAARLRVLRGYTAVKLLATGAFWRSVLAAGGAAALAVLWLGQRRRSTLGPARPPGRAPDWLALVHVPLVETSPDGRISRMNAAAVAALGGDSGALAGRPLRSLLRVRDATGTLIDGLTVGRHEGQWYAPDGRIQPVELNVSRADLGDGQRLLVEWRDACPAVDAMAPRRDPAFDQLTTAALVTDAVGRLQRVNAAAARMFGYTPEELKSLTIGKLMPVPFLNQTDVTLASFVDAAPARLPQVVGWRKDATHFRVELGVAPLPGGAGYVIHVIDADHAQLDAPAHQRWGVLTYAAGDPALIVDAHNLYVLDANPAAGRVLEVDAGQWRRMTLRHFVAPEHAAGLDADLQRLREAAAPVVVVQGGCITSSGAIRPGQWRISYSRDIDPPAFLAVFSS